eukprot:14119354-Alexandrium_andersonii.AAC.1
MALLRRSRTPARCQTSHRAKRPSGVDHMEGRNRPLKCSAPLGVGVLGDDVGVRVHADALP